MNRRFSGGAISAIPAFPAPTELRPSFIGSWSLSVLRFLVFLVSILTATLAPAQSVLVSLRADKPVIAVGETTTLRVTAQVVPSLRPRAQQIFAWHLDLVQEFADPVELSLASIARPSSDRDPGTSSAGTLEGNFLKGIYDTFVGFPTAGVADPVVLLTVPVVGRREGVAVFRMQAGSGPTNLSGDFLVTGTNPDDVWTGGNYTNAVASIEVRPTPLEPPRLTISLDRSTTGQGGIVMLDFPVFSGLLYTVQFTEAIGSGAVWQNLPDAPHNTGRATDRLGIGSRFYRVAVTD